MHALGKLMVAHEVANLQGFIGHHVVRRGQRARRFAGAVFAPPLDAQIGAG